MRCWARIAAGALPDLGGDVAGLQTGRRRSPALLRSDHDPQSVLADSVEGVVHVDGSRLIAFSRRVDRGSEA